MCAVSLRHFTNRGWLLLYHSVGTKKEDERLKFCLEAGVLLLASDGSAPSLLMQLRAAGPAQMGLDLNPPANIFHPTQCRARHSGTTPWPSRHTHPSLCRFSSVRPLPTQALQRLSEPGVTELILPDCSRIEKDQMRDSLLQCRSSLRLLRLGTCGRCVGDETVEALAAAGGAPRLKMAALAGEARGSGGMRSDSLSDAFQLGVAG